MLFCFTQLENSRKTKNFYLLSFESSLSSGNVLVVRIEKRSIFSSNPECLEASAESTDPLSHVIRPFSYPFADIHFPSFKFRCSVPQGVFFQLLEYKFLSVWYISISHTSELHPSCNERLLWTRQAPWLRAYD